jgi:hypothetical protein
MNGIRFSCPTVVCWPLPISAEAAEGGPYEEGLGEGDTITVVFNKPTNVIPLGSNDRVYGLFNLSSSLGVLNAYVNRRGAVSTSIMSI